jgi:alkanesulfonate monooxygenase SsuD/methylene tetrahydromethanopterin reductase-like flavin-dependent oxidoreductase (luciferase family)
MAVALDVGVGLWCMRSTAAAPASTPALYRELVADARLAEELGLHSLWLSEHHFWYDGWCPALLVAAAAAAGATRRLHIGTGVFLLPLHDPHRVADAGLELERLAAGRIELGIGLGYRDAEYDALGRSRRTRGRTVDESLGVLGAAWAGGGPRVWIGGIAERPLRRAAEHGLSIFLPSSMSESQLARAIDRVRATAAEHGTPAPRIGMLKNAWVTDGGRDEERRMRDLVADAQREYAGAWWLLGGHLGFDEPALLEEQMRRASDTALVGPPAAVAQELARLAGLGVDLVVLHIATDRTRPGYRENMRRVATEVLPALR